MWTQLSGTDLLVLIKGGLQLVHVPEGQHADEGWLIGAQSLDACLVQFGSILTGQVHVHHSCWALGPDLLQLLCCQLMAVALSQHQQRIIRFGGEQYQFSFLFESWGLWTLIMTVPLTMNKTLKWLTPLLTLNAVLFWWWRCRNYSSPQPPPPFPWCLCGDNSVLKKPNSNNYRNMKAEPTWQQETSSFLKWPLVSSVMSFSRSRWKSATPIDISTVMQNPCFTQQKQDKKQPPNIRNGMFENWNNNNTLFMAPNLIKAQSVYKNIRLHSFHHTHTHMHAHMHTHACTHTHTHTHTCMHTCTHTHTHTHTHYKYMNYWR